MDLRVDLILRVGQDHMVSRAATKDAFGGEEWLCRCGVHYKGDGALSNGRRHVASETLSALDDAAMTP